MTTLSAGLLQLTTLLQQLDHFAAPGAVYPSPRANLNGLSPVATVFIDQPRSVTLAKSMSRTDNGYLVQLWIRADESKGDDPDAAEDQLAVLLTDLELVLNAFPNCSVTKMDATPGGRALVKKVGVIYRQADIHVTLTEYT